MTTQNGTTNGTTDTAKVKGPTCLDGSKERFKARKNPPSEKEEVAAWKAYFSAEEKLKKAQEAVEAAMAERTAACKELVAVRGADQRKIEGKGVGRFMTRGESAWVLFPGEDDSAALKV